MQQAKVWSKQSLRGNSIRVKSCSGRFVERWLKQQNASATSKTYILNLDLVCSLRDNLSKRKYQVVPQYDCGVSLSPSKTDSPKLEIALLQHLWCICSFAFVFTNWFPSSKFILALSFSYPLPGKEKHSNGRVDCSIAWAVLSYICWISFPSVLQLMRITFDLKQLCWILLP